MGKSAPREKKICGSAHTNGEVAAAEDSVAWAAAYSYNAPVWVDAVRSSFVYCCRYAVFAGVPADWRTVAAL